ncbi:MAG TPA: hypothetical protein VLX67_05030 [Stellaceae bacterium]|nr:hypothetical protein [Stellaceae bacterium]
MAPRWWFLGIGAASGLLAAASVVVFHLGDVAAPKVAGYCFGLRVSSRCEGVDAALYLFPGTIFGVVFIAWERWRRRIDLGRLIGFAVASGVGNAVAVFLCVWLTDRLGDALDIDFLNLPMALAGAISGAAGGALLGGSAKALSLGFNLHRSVIAASALGLLVPLVVTWEIAGVFLFYIIWQGGYAVALTAGLPAET